VAALSAWAAGAQSESAGRNTKKLRKPGAGLGELAPWPLAVPRKSQGEGLRLQAFRPAGVKALAVTPSRQPQLPPRAARSDRGAARRIHPAGSESSGHRHGPTSSAYARGFWRSNEQASPTMPRRRVESRQSCASRSLLQPTPAFQTISLEGRAFAWQAESSKSKHPRPVDQSAQPGPPTKPGGADQGSNCRAPRGVHSPNAAGDGGMQEKIPFCAGNGPAAVAAGTPGSQSPASVSSPRSTLDTSRGCLERPLADRGGPVIGKRDAMAMPSPQSGAQSCRRYLPIIRHPAVDSGNPVKAKLHLLKDRDDPPTRLIPAGGLARK